jgi:hypothetical protein
MGIDVAVELLARHVDAATAETGDAAHQRINHALDQRAGDAGIDRVAALAQDVGTRLGRLGLRGNDHRLLRVTHDVSSFIQLYQSNGAPTLQPARRSVSRRYIQS